MIAAACNGGSGSKKLVLYGAIIVEFEDKKQE